jgi:hypothetical protein
VYYLPNGGFVGKDRFTYTVCDNGTTNGMVDPKCTLSIVSVTVKEAIAADLSISVVPSTASVPAQSDVTFVATLRNNGPDDANLITYGLDASNTTTSLVSVSGAAGRCSSHVRGFECVVAALAPGAIVTAMVVMNMKAVGQTQLSARLSSATDSTPSNNVDSVTVDVRCLRSPLVYVFACVVVALVLRHADFSTSPISADVANGRHVALDPDREGKTKRVLAINR